MKIKLRIHPKKRFVIIAASVIAAVIAAAVIYSVNTANRNMRKAECDLYFMNDSGTSLVAEKREIKYSDEAGLPDNVIIQLIKGPSDSEKKPTIGKSTSYLGMETDHDGKTTVNFSADFITGDTNKDAFAVYSVVKTLCCLSNISSVRVLADGKEIKAADGSAMTYMSSEDINLETDAHTSETRNVTLYFPKKNSDKFGKEVRSVKVTDQQPIEQYIIDELIKGPSSGDLTSALDKNTALISVDIYADTCFVNFNSNFIDKNSGTEQKEKAAVYSIVTSLTDIERINRVQFLLDGKKEKGFNNMDISGIMMRDAALIE